MARKIYKTREQAEGHMAYLVLEENAYEWQEIWVEEIKGGYVLMSYNLFDHTPVEVRI